MHFETLAIKASQMVDDTAGSVAPPLYLTTTFERSEDGTFPHDYIYTRANNPNRQSLEQAYAALEGGAEGMAFGSGQAATATIFQCLSAGDHIIIPEDSYHGIAALLMEVFDRWQLSFTRVDTTNINAVESAKRHNTKLLWLETPSNPLLKITDVRQLAQWAKQNGIISVCDNTWATPVLQRPLDLGCEVSMHSATKYFGGHSDVLGGALIFKENNDLAQKARRIQALSGGVPSPFDCWLLLRGIKTLALRVRQQSANALALAEFLSQHPAIEQVNYPGLTTHPNHTIAKGQMSAFGGMMSIQVRGGLEAAMGVAARTQIFIRATSLGGIESLIEHRASVEGPNSQTPTNLLRMSIGLENVEDLINDLAAALHLKKTEFL
jgi:cystathionine gamma-synthase